MNPSTALLIAKLLDLAILAATKGPSYIEGLRSHRERVQRMIDEGRNPTREELAQLETAVEAHRARLHAVDTSGHG